MDNPAVLLLLLEQGNRSLEDHTRDFVYLAPLTHYPDSCLCTFYRAGLNIATKAQLSGEHPRESIADYIEWVLFEPGPTTDDEPEPRVTEPRIATEPEPYSSDQVREPATATATVECNVEQEMAMESPAHCTTAGGELEHNSGDLIDFFTEVLVHNSGDLIDFSMEISTCYDIPACLESPLTLPPSSAHVNVSPLQWARRGSASFHRCQGWRIPHLRLQPQSRTLPQPSDPAAPPRLSAPSSPSSPVCPPAPPDLLVSPAPPWSVVVPPSPQDSAPLAAPRHSVPPAPKDSSLPPAPPRLSAPSSPSSPVCPPAPPDLLVSPATPWSVVVPPSPQDSAPLAAPRHSVPPAPKDSSLPPAQPPSSVAPALPRTSRSPPRSLEPRAPPWTSGSSVSPRIFGSPSLPRAPLPAAPPLSVGPFGVVSPFSLRRLHRGSSWLRPGSCLVPSALGPSSFLLGSSHLRHPPGLFCVPLNGLSGHGLLSFPIRHGLLNCLVRPGGRSCLLCLRLPTSGVPTYPPLWMLYGARRAYSEGGVMSQLCLFVYLVFPIVSPCQSVCFGLALISVIPFTCL
ncbi:Titin [Labeo rohita]|uniref:Titin n=1 Tax=Labeo rohita TaxID=84645 RepID=A0ABQ8L5J8_LABRO|nr:Titin [Labeo rohita]